MGLGLGVALALGALAGTFAGAGAFAGALLSDVLGFEVRDFAGATALFEAVLVAFFLTVAFGGMVIF